MKNTLIKQVEVSDNNRKAKNVKCFVAEAEYRYFRRLEKVAEKIECDIENKWVLLLAGPSGSGKTTTAQEISARLHAGGIHAPVVSLDDFYVSVDRLPKREDGSPDYESIYGLDLACLSRCFEKLVKTGRALFPKYDFANQCSIPEANCIEIGEKDILIIEGIHALNPLIRGNFDNDIFIKLYVRTATEFVHQGKMIFSPEDTRKVRRMIRDYYYRATPPEDTLDMWKGVVEGEKLYIDPFVNEADYMINTTHDYEPHVFHYYLLPLFRETIERGATKYLDEFIRLKDAFNLFDDISAELLPESSMLREFIPGKEK